MQRIITLTLICLTALTICPAYAGEDYQDVWDSYITAIRDVRNKPPDEREKALYSLYSQYRDVYFDVTFGSPLEADLEGIAEEFESDVAREVIFFIENDENPKVRVAALRLFSRVDIPRAEARRVLGNAIDDPDPEVRSVAIDSIGNYLYYPAREYEPFSLLYMKGLRDKDPRVRIEAIESPYFIRGNQAIQSAVFSLLRDEDYNVRLAAAMQLVLFDLATEEAFAILLEAFRKNPYEPVVIYTVGKSGSLGQSAIPELIDIINTMPTLPTTRELLDRWEPGDDFIEILRENKPDSPLITELDAYGADWYELEYREGKDRYLIRAHWENGWSELCTVWWISDHSIRASATYALAKISNEPEIIDFIITLFKDESPVVRRAAAEAFRRLSPPEEKAIQPLIDLLTNDPDDKVRATAASILSLQAVGVPYALPAMIDALDDEDSSIRRSAQWYVQQLGPDAADAVPILIKMLPDVDDDEQDSIINTLDSIGEAASEAVPFIVDMIADPDKDVSEAAYRFLRNFPSCAESIVPLLMDHLRNSPDDVPYYESETLGILGKNIDGVKTELIEMLNDENWNIQEKAIIALGAMGSDAADLVPIFIDMLETDEVVLKGRVALALGEIGPDASPAVPLLIEMLGDENRRIVLTALDAISNIGPDAAGAIPTILEMIETNDPYIHVNLILALGEIGTNNPELIPFLIDLLAREDDGTRWHVAMVIGNFGPDASDALPLLYEYVDYYDDAWFEQAMLGAIEKIEGTNSES